MSLTRRQFLAAMGTAATISLVEADAIVDGIDCDNLNVLPQAYPQPLTERLLHALDRRKQFGIPSRTIYLSHDARRRLLIEYEFEGYWGQTILRFRGIPCIATEHCNGDDFVITDMKAGEVS